MSGSTSTGKPKLPLVLVVEDDPAISDPVCSMLRHSGFAPQCVATLAEARTFLRAIYPDCLLLDVRLPDGDAESLLVELTRQEKAPPTVLLSAATRAENIASRFGITLVKKPFDDEALLGAVRVAMETVTKPIDAEAT